jgi:hypothetical protein
MVKKLKKGKTAPKIASTTKEANSKGEGEKVKYEWSVFLNATRTHSRVQLDTKMVISITLW